MRVALICEWLTVYAGAERVNEQILQVFPDADLFALVDFMPEAERPFLQGKTVRTSFIQKLPFARKRFRSYLPLFPFAIEQLDLSGYDLVISSSYAVAKGVLTGPDQLHICVCHSPIRYAWDMEREYLGERKLDAGLRGQLVKYVLHRIRQWDAASAGRVDYYIANSNFTAARIRKYYRRDATVIFPPVALDAFTLKETKEDFYLIACRQVPYKKVPTMVEAFRRMPQRRLVVIGDGPEAPRVVQAAASAPNVSVLGYQPSATLQDHMRRAKAFVFAGKEDFGIVLVEAQACGTPVITLNRGGALDIIRPLGLLAPTGVLFEEPTPEAICKAIDKFEASQDDILPSACRRNAERFGVDRFRSELAATIERMVVGTEKSGAQVRHVIGYLAN